jgi:DNA-binding response OmpR family regulator
MPGLLVALIEDDPLIRVPLAQGLQSAGFEVVAAASGAEGLTVLDDPRVAVAVVDVRLPGRLDGVGMVREARRRNPRLKAVMTSGGAVPGDVSDIGPFLPKPFRMPELVAVIRSLLER